MDLAVLTLILDPVHHYRIAVLTRLSGSNTASTATNAASTPSPSAADDASTVCSLADGQLKPADSKTLLLERTSGQYEKSSFANEEDEGNHFSACKVRIASQSTSVRPQSKCDSKVARHAAADRAKDERYQAAALKFPERAVGMRRQVRDGRETDVDERQNFEIAASLEGLQEQVLAGKDLRDVVLWGCEKIVKVTPVSLGDRAFRSADWESDGEC